MEEAITIDEQEAWGRPDTELIAAIGGNLDRLRRIARMIVGDADLADDLVSDALAATLPHWRSGTIDNPYPYLPRSMVNLAARRWNRRQIGNARDHNAIDWLPTPNDTTQAIVERDRTLTAIAGLPPRRRIIVVLRFYDDLTLKTIAEILDIGVGTVKSQLSKALRQLRPELETGSTSREDRQ